MYYHQNSQANSVINFTYKVVHPNISKWWISWFLLIQGAIASLTEESESGQHSLLYQTNKQSLLTTCDSLAGTIIIHTATELMHEGSLVAMCMTMTGICSELSDGSPCHFSYVLTWVCKNTLRQKYINLIIMFVQITLLIVYYIIKP